MARRVKCLCLIVCLFPMGRGVHAQSFWVSADSLYPARLNTVAIVGGAGATASLAALYSVWYAQYPQSGFHGVNDFDNWLAMDKLGHAYTAYTVGDQSYALLRWSGLDRRSSIWYGGLSGWTYLAVIEVMDGFSQEWGFSSGDLAMNTLGAGLFIGQQLAWNEQRIQMKYSYHPTDFAALRPEVLGSGWSESWLKDYNGQTYWLSASPALFMDDTRWPEWLNLAVGYGATGMTGGDSNPMVNSDGILIPTYRRGSQYYLSFDINLTRIPVKSNFWRAVFNVINVIKIPAPTLEFRSTDQRIYFHPIYF